MAIREYRPVTTAPGPTSIRQISPERAGDTSGLQRLGAAVTDVAFTLENARQEAENLEARTALTKGVGDLNAELTQDTDFATMRGRYGARLDALQEEVMGGVSTPRQKRLMEAELARARVAVEANVFQREFDLRGSQARATLAASLRQTANTIPAAGSDEERALAYERALASIAAMKEAGYIDAEEAETLRARLDRDVADALVLDAINKDPASAAATLGQPGAFGLDETDRQRYLSTATRISEQDGRATQSKLETRLDTARRVLVSGGTLATEDLDALRQEVSGTDLAPKLEGAVLASQQLGHFYQAAPAERAALIAAERAKGITIEDASIDGARLAALEEIDAAATKDLATDPIGYAVKAGLVGAAPLDLSDQASVNDRMALVQELKGQYGAAPRIFSEAERKGFKEIAETGTVEDQMALLVSINDGFGAGAGAAFAELDNIDAAMRRAGALVFETGNDDVARTILAGRVAMKAGDELSAPSDAALGAFEASFDGVLGARPGRREEWIGAVRAYYAAKAPGRVTQNDLRGQRELLAEAAQAVAGGVVVQGKTWGGIQEVNGRRVKLPVTLDGNSAERLLSEADEAAWRAGSLSGNLPHEGEAPQIPKGAVLQWVDGSTYRVGIPSRRGQVEWLLDPRMSNGFFYVDLDKMAAAYLKSRPADE